MDDGSQESEKFVRTNISIPPSLKRQMDEVADQTNWSEVARRAFEAHLAEIAARKERRTMEDVITRLRASKNRSDDIEYKNGEKSGRRWAERDAEAYQLIALDQLRLEETDDVRRLLEQIHVALFGVSSAAYQQGMDLLQDWLELYPVGAGEMCPGEQHIRGFVEGARSLWNEVKDRV